MIETRKLVRAFKNGEETVQILKGIDFVAESGEFVAIMGRSGAGKSTFLYQISLLDEPTSGEILIDGREVHTMSTKEKTAYRLSALGYVFQEYALLPELSALENVALPLLMQNMKPKNAYKKAEESLTRVRLGHRLHSLPSQLSGGEQQRVSISRAIAHKPSILFADEPTANLDNESAHTVIELFQELNREGQTIIMVTHEEEFGHLAQTTIRLDDGQIISRVKNRGR